MPPDDFARAQQFFQHGDPSGAAAICQAIVRAQPRHQGAWHLLALIADAANNASGLGLALKGLGNALAAAQQQSDAQTIFRRALELRSNDIELLNNLGVVCLELNQHAEAIPYYQRAIALQPATAELHNNLGNAHAALGQTAAAAAAYRQALAHKPNYPKCANNLGVLLIGAGQFEDAARVLGTAVELRPDLPELQCNLGVAHKNLGRLDLAMTAYRQALTADPTFADAHLNLGNVLLDLGQLDKAALAYRQAISLRPNDVELHQHLALACKRQGDTVQAGAALRGALAIRPGDVITALRAATLVPMIFPDQAAIDAQCRELLQACRRFAPLTGAIKRLDLLSSHAEAPFHAQFFDGNVREVREAYADLFAPLFQGDPPPRRTGEPRVGFILSKGHDGVFLKSLKGVIQRLDRELCKVVILAPTIAVPRLTRDIARDHVEIIALPERGDRLVETVRGAALDVLYHWEVGTDANNYFLPMFRLANVQCTSWGIQQTSGMRQMDFYLSSKLVEPPNAAEHYREELLLADTLLTYQFRPSMPPEMKSRADFGFRDDQHVFACAQHLGKFHPDFDATLGEILCRDAHAVFAVTEDRYGVGANLLRQRWSRTLSDVQDRFVFLPRLPEQEYRALLAASDVLLDPPHFGGVNSTYDGFALGQPIVTCPSGFHRGRYTLGCYQKMQLRDFVAASAAQYAEIALKLATDADYRRHARERIRAASEALWEDNQAVREHERLIALMIERARDSRR